jgi:TPR repeat protein
MRVDKDEAIRLFTAASNEGHAGAFCELGQCYYDGYGPLKKDRKVALSCFETAAAAGHAPAEQILRDRKAAWKKIKR